MEMCKHTIRSKGVCSLCSVVTCLCGINNCFCSVGWPYELMCKLCRDDKRRSYDHGYCICVPLTTSDRVGSRWDEFNSSTQNRE